ncbi:MAG: MotA/TolQ/ExbB proton channel family protein [Synergistaceae bacterium]|nr:MotA/TolQ/ExbB proton channel family protein [Synergistaceae bacterium]
MNDLIINGLWRYLSAKIFTCVISFVFIVSLICLCFTRNINKREWIINRAPSLLTSLGLFGTFWGVAEGLGYFNAHDIDASVITLLDGMKLAFWTSILGMFYAFLINIINYASGLVRLEAAEDVNNQDGELIKKFNELIIALNQLEDLKSYKAEALGEIINEINNISLKVQESAGLVEKSAQSMERAARTQLDAMAKIEFNINTALNKAIENMQNAFRRSLNGIEQINKSAYDKLNAEMEAALSAVVKSMAGKLAGMSGKLFDDYEILINKLSELAKLAENINHEN